MGTRYSIVVPTFQRKQRLHECLHGLSLIDYPRAQFEVIVVDDGSPTSPDDVVRSYEHLLTIRLVVVLPNAGPAKARNAGAAQARGTYLALIDDDCIPDADWLIRMDERLRAFPEALVGGAMRNGAPDSICAEASQQLVEFLYRYYNSDVDNTRCFMSANIVCPREQFLSLVCFGTDFPLASA